MKGLLLGIGATAAIGIGAGSAMAQSASPPPATPPAQSASPAPAEPSAQLTPPAGASVYIISPANGARITGPVVVRFGLRNMGVTQAGSTAKNAGHHHLLVDVTEPVSPTDPLPADKTHLHFGGGQTETKLDLPLGRHTLQLVLGDSSHRPFNPSLTSPKIEVFVVPPKPKTRMRPIARRHPRHRLYYRG